MQYRRHNFNQNFLNATSTDTDVAWEILVNEVNELSIDQPSKIIAVLRKNNIKVADNTSAKTLSLTVFDKIYTNPALQKDILDLVAIRHTDPYVNADGLTTGPTTASADIIAATDSLIKDTTGLTKTQVKKLVTDDIKSKLDQKGIKAGINPLKILFFVGLVSAVAFTIYKIVKKQPILPA